MKHENGNGSTKRFGLGDHQSFGEEMLGPQREIIMVISLAMIGDWDG